MIYDAVIVVQARMESVRLPGKVLLPINNKPLIIELLNRLQTIPCKKLITAISNDINSDILFKVLKDNNFNVYKGHPTNVYERFYNAIKDENALSIVRVTADNPLTDLEAIKKGIDKLLNENLDYVWMENCPKGLGCDIFKTKTLKLFIHENLTEYEKEHIVPIFRNRNFLKGGTVIMPFQPKELSINFSIDTKNDYDFVNNIYKKFCNNKAIADVKDFIKELF